MNPTDWKISEMYYFEERTSFKKTEAFDVLFYLLGWLCNIDCGQKNWSLKCNLRLMFDQMKEQYTRP